MFVALQTRELSRKKNEINQKVTGLLVNPFNLVIKMWVSLAVDCGLLRFWLNARD